MLQITSRRSLRLSDYRHLAEFRYQLRLFVHASEEAARRSGLEPQHHQLLLAVKGMPADRRTRIADLAERLQLQHHTVVELVGRLEVRGLVERIRGEADRREVQVKLTSHGENVLAELTVHTRGELRLAAPALVAALQKIEEQGKSRKIARRNGRPKGRIGARKA